MLKARKKSVINIGIMSVCLLLGMFIYHTAVKSTTEIPKLIIPKTGHEDALTNNITLDIADHFSQNSANPVAGVYRADVDIEKEQALICDILDLDDIADFGSLQSSVPISSTENIGLDPTSGRWYYHTDMAYYTGENVPDQEEALQIVEDFLNEYNLYPMDQLGSPTISPVTSGDGVNQPKKVLCWDISYDPQVDGMDVYGVFRICISVGSNGEIVSIEKLANKYKFVENVPLKNASDIEKDISDGAYSISSNTPNRSTIISDVEIKLYSDPESDFIQPIYELSDKDDSVFILIDAHLR